MCSITIDHSEGSRCRCFYFYFYGVEFWNESNKTVQMILKYKVVCVCVFFVFQSGPCSSQRMGFQTPKRAWNSVMWSLTCTVDMMHTEGLLLKIHFMQAHVSVKRSQSVYRHLPVPIYYKHNNRVSTPNIWFGSHVAWTCVFKKGELGWIQAPS